MARERCNIAVVRRFIDGAINGRDLAVVDESWADDMTWHGTSLGTYESKAAFLEFAKANAGGAWTRCTSRSTTRSQLANSGSRDSPTAEPNVGPFMVTPATGKRAEWFGIGIYAVCRGRIIEGWFAEDILGLLLQLDAIALP